MTNSLLYDLVNQMYQYRDEKEEAPKDKIFDAESKVIRDLANKGNCVIIGRCSDYVLRDDDRVLKVIFYRSDGEPHRACDETTRSRIRQCTAQDTKRR